MAPIPPPNDQIASAIDKHHASKADYPRPHLGASMLGHHCDRWIWLNFRWAVKESFPGRIKRLFRRGHSEEAVMVADLKAIGVNLTKTEYDQTRIAFGTHIGGSVDGIIEGGVPGAEEVRHIAEFKTHNKRSFDDLIKKGVHESKPIHWGQVQLYMHGTNIERALYVAVCKDDDRLYSERIKYDKGAAEKLLDRGRRIALAERMPEPISADPSWYQCKMCAAQEFCHSSKLTQEVNCRTCAHSTPTSDGKWSCARWDADHVEVEHQVTGCHAHVLHPDLVPWDRRASSDPNEAVYVIEGQEVRNGEGDAFTFSSQELIEGRDACVNHLVREAKKIFPDAKMEVKYAPPVSTESD